MRTLILFFVVVGLSHNPNQTLLAQALAQHVIVIGVDGMSPDGIRHAETSNMDTLMLRGCSSMTAQAVLPTSSSPNWASMIMGAGPKQHGIKSNAWRPKKDRRRSHCGGPKGQRWPSMFSVLRHARPEADIAVFHDWGGFGRLVEPGVCNVLNNTAGPDRTAEKAAAYFQLEVPELLFVHLDHVDGAGHQFGHGSPEYYRAVSKADRLIGTIVQAVESAGKAGETLIIVTSDHGGKGKGHGGDSPEEKTIPWIAAGSGVQQGADLPEGFPTYRTASTVLYALGLERPDCWIAEPIEVAFAVP